MALFVATLAIFGTSRVHQFADSYYSMLLSEHLLTRGSFESINGRWSRPPWPDAAG